MSAVSSWMRNTEAWHLKWSMGEKANTLSENKDLSHCVRTELMICEELKTHFKKVYFTLENIWEYQWNILRK